MPEVNITDVVEPVTIVLADADLPDSQTLEQTPVPVPEPVPAPAVVAAEPEPSDDPVLAVEKMRKALAESNADRDRSSLALAEESRRRQDAERLAQQNAGRANDAAATAAQSNYDMVISALTAAEAQASQLTADHAKAMTDGDFALASKIQMDMAKVGGRIDRLETGKIEMDAQRSSQPAQRPAQSQPQPQPATGDWNRPWNRDEAESYLRGRTPQTAAWIRQNDRFIHDVKFRNQVVAAHSLAEAKGFPADSDEYFRFVNAQVGATEPEPEVTPEPTVKPVPKAPVAAAAKVTARQSPTVSAPPSRVVQGGAPGTQGGSPVTLTVEERKAARQMFTKDVIGDQDPEVVYARQKLALIAEGKIPA